MYNPLRHPDSDEPWPIPVTTGGPIGARDHVGHIAEYDRILDATLGPNQLGALLTGDRRQGKTSMLNLVEEVLAGDDSVRMLRLSAETSDPEVLGSRLKEQVRHASWLGREAERWALDVEVSFRGFHLRRTGGKRDAPDEDTDDLLVLAARKAAPRRLVVIIDEVTVFVDALSKTDSDAGLEFLRALRRARQDGADNLAVVLSGSVGLHHVVPTMQAVNDLLPVRIGSLASDESVFLAHCLILGAGIESDDGDALALAMADAADGGAFYLHHVANELRKAGRVSPADADAALRRLIDDPDDPLHFRHYRDRLPSYYGEDAPLAAQVLDAVAMNPSPAMSTDEVVDAVTIASGAPEPRERVASILERLEQDHYLQPVPHGTAFTTSLLRTAWIVVRRLDR